MLLKTYSSVWEWQPAWLRELCAVYWSAPRAEFHWKLGQEGYSQTKSRPTGPGHEALYSHQSGEWYVVPGLLSRPERPCDITLDMRSNFGTGILIDLLLFFFFFNIVILLRKFCTLQSVLLPLLVRSLSNFQVRKERNWHSGFRTTFFSLIPQCFIQTWNFTTSSHSKYRYKKENAYEITQNIQHSLKSVQVL